jgi:hypothetical protein
MPKILKVKVRVGTGTVLPKKQWSGPASVPQRTGLIFKRLRLQVKFLKQTKVSLSVVVSSDSACLQLVCS